MLDLIPELRAVEQRTLFMDLLQLKAYIQKRKMASLADIANHFRTNPLTIAPMLDIWIRKGKINHHTCNHSCSGGCCSCEPATVKIYEWKG